MSSGVHLRPRNAHWGTINAQKSDSHTVTAAHPARPPHMNDSHRLRDPVRGLEWVTTEAAGALDGGAVELEEAMMRLRDEKRVEAGNLDENSTRGSPKRLYMPSSKT